MARGAFIVVEGLDRSGKTTQCTALHRQLEADGVPVKLQKFPDRTTATGKMIDSYLQSQSDLDDRAIHLLFSANRWEAAESLVQLLESGTSIICDRYAFSGIAFSTAKSLPTAPSSKPDPSSNVPPPTSTTTSTLTYEWCRAPDIGLPAPDLVLFLDVSPEIQAQRGGFGEERYEKADLQRRVREVFRRIEGEFTDIGNGGEIGASLKWCRIDAGRTQDEVWDDVWEAVKPFVHTRAEAGSTAQGTIKRLWNHLQ
ncbi:P-loop containing nucleoside triphosphate hydrolase protein [Clavulina sp. PMI_390]|nr:P-loop containing nucleoside triphosphate hydrolase protein [Clavulina sp. PMI_390]